MGTRKLLIIEDEIISALALKTHLVKEGFDVIDIVARPSHALEICREQRVDAVLLDVNLGHGENGVDLAIRIQQEQDIPVLFFTGYSLEQLPLYVDTVHSIDVFQKPIIVEEISRRLNEWFSPDILAQR